MKATDSQTLSSPSKGKVTDKLTQSRASFYFGSACAGMARVVVGNFIYAKIQL